MDPWGWPLLVTLQVNSPSAWSVSVIAVSGEGAAFQVPASSAGGGGGAGASAGSVEGAAAAAGEVAGVVSVPGACTLGTVAVVGTNGFPPIVAGWAPATAGAVVAEGVAAGSLALTKALANEAES
jgi:hypothetical protein